MQCCFESVKKSIVILLGVISVCIFCIKGYALSEEIPVPLEYQLYAWELENEYGIDAELLLSLCYEESRFIHLDNLTQIMNPKWYKKEIEATEVDDLSDPFQNMKVCAYCLMEYSLEYPENQFLWCRMWNEGYHNAKKNEEKISNYSRRIVERAEEWKAINQRKEELKP